MIVAVHALTGAALAPLCRTRWQAALAGAASHMVLDMLPHRDLDMGKEAALLAGALALTAAARGTGSKEFAGAIGAALPDLENLIARVANLPEDRMLLPTHRGRHGREARDFRGQGLLALAGAVSLLLPTVSRTIANVVSRTDGEDEATRRAAVGSE